MDIELDYIENDEHYRRLIRSGVMTARESVWISTANVKDMHVENTGGTFVSLLKILADLTYQGVDVRILHSGIPTENFLASFRDCRGLFVRGKFVMRRCPRVHFKLFIIDSNVVYLGSANLTGAGFGAKNDRRRNFETGIVTSDDRLLAKVGSLYESIWLGEHCTDCALKDTECHVPLEELNPDTQI